MTVVEWDTNAVEAKALEESGICIGEKVFQALEYGCDQKCYNQKKRPSVPPHLVEEKLRLLFSDYTLKRFSDLKLTPGVTYQQFNFGLVGW
jgi:hypothetical protein